jgi:hypothetical protein
MLRIVPHTVPRVGRSYEHFPDGFELHLLPQEEKEVHKMHRRTIHVDKVRLLLRIVKQFRGGILLKAHRRWYHSTLGSRVIKKKANQVRHLGCGLKQGTDEVRGLIWKLVHFTTVRY